MPEGVAGIRFGSKLQDIYAACGGVIFTKQDDPSIVSCPNPPVYVRGTKDGVVVTMNAGIATVMSLTFSDGLTPFELVSAKYGPASRTLPTTGFSGTPGDQCTWALDDGQLELRYYAGAWRLMYLHVLEHLVQEGAY